MKPLQLQEAKQQFSAVAERAAGGQPQIVTNGKPFVVILSVAAWQEARPKERTLLEMLRSCPVTSDELDLKRSKELARNIAL